MTDKLSYYQGTEKPTPGNKKYKSEKAIVVQPRFEEPFYRNYDLYDTEGVDGKAKHGPGVGLHSKKYKSVSEFRKSKEKNKAKYKANDSWIEDDGRKTKKRAFRRMLLLKSLVKNGIDFPIDEQISNPILGDSGTVSDSVPIGGFSDQYLPLNDFEGKSPTELNFGRDYFTGCYNCGFRGTANGETYDPGFPCPKCGTGEVENDLMAKVNNKYVNPAGHVAEPTPLGLLNEISPPEDLDADFTLSDQNPEYGTRDSGNNTFENMWI